MLGLRETVALCVSYSCMAADNPSAVRQCPSNRFIVYGKWAPDTKTLDPDRRRIIDPSATFAVRLGWIADRIWFRREVFAFLRLSLLCVR